MKLSTQGVVIVAAQTVLAFALLIAAAVHAFRGQYGWSTFGSVLVLINLCCAWVNLRTIRRCRAINE